MSALESEVTESAEFQSDTVSDETQRWSSLSSDQ